MVTFGFLGVESSQRIRRRVGYGNTVPFGKDGTDDTDRFALVQVVYIGCDLLQRIADDYSVLFSPPTTGKMYYTSCNSSQTFRIIR